jgi:hypothetical protein
MYRILFSMFPNVLWGIGDNFLDSTHIAIQVADKKILSRFFFWGGERGISSNLRKLKILLYVTELVLVVNMHEMF